VELPGYAFEEERYWVEGVGDRTRSEIVRRKADVGDWFYLPVWKETTAVIGSEEQKGGQRWLIMEDEGGIGARIASELEQQGCVITRVKRAQQYERRGEREYRIRVGEPGDYQAVLKELEECGELPEKIAHLFSLSPAENETNERGFYSLVYLTQAIGQMTGVKEVEVMVVGNGAMDVVGEEEVRGEKAMILGPVRVMRQEYPQVKSRYIDVVIPAPGSRQEKRLVKQLVWDLGKESADQVIAYRGNHRWAQTSEAARSEPD
jgi:acyl transferase domain-containing protein